MQNANSKPAMPGLPFLKVPPIYHNRQQWVSVACILCRSKEGALHSAHSLWLCPSVNAWFSFKDPLWSSSSWWYQELDLANLWCSDIHVWDKAWQQLLQIAPLTTEVIMTQWEQRPFGGHTPRFRNMSFKNYWGHCALISAGVLYLSDWLSALMGHSVKKLMF